MADENNDYSYLVNVSSDKIIDTINGLNEEIKKLQQEKNDLKNQELESLDRMHKEVDIEANIDQIMRVISVLSRRQTQLNDMHDMYIENFGGLDEIGSRGSR